MSTKCSYFYVKANQRDDTKEEDGGINDERSEEQHRGSAGEQQESGQQPSNRGLENRHTGV